MSVKDKVTESEENSNFLGESQGGGGKEKKLIVEVEPADYENDFIDSLRDQEDVLPSVFIENIFLNRQTENLEWMI